jgi:PhzF family phenazine biosynthesis protein
MKLTQYQVDAFADQPFRGNPAAVCPLDQWLDDDLMQAIAAENNLAETAFFVAQGAEFQIRWFTPSTEVDLCGHATLASAFVLFNELGHTANSITFNSRSGPLIVSQDGRFLVMDFPSESPKQCEPPQGLADALGCDVGDCFFREDYIVELESEAQLKALQPDFSLLGKIQARGIIVTSKSQEYDFVNRFFAPQVGIDEDPVTGSAFTKLIPFWSERLAKKALIAKQVSARGGIVYCQFEGDRVRISGQAVLFMKGEIYV